MTNERRQSRDWLTPEQLRIRTKRNNDWALRWIRVWLADAERNQQIRLVTSRIASARSAAARAGVQKIREKQDCRRVRRIGAPARCKVSKSLAGAASQSSRSGRELRFSGEAEFERADQGRRLPRNR
jgi:hypothetical protein